MRNIVLYMYCQPSILGDSQTTIPETPVSETPSSPCSSVFQQKQKFRQENVIESDEEVNSSADWMSKDKGIVMNGNCKGHRYIMFYNQLLIYTLVIYYSKLNFTGKYLQKDKNTNL